MTELNPGRSFAWKSSFPGVTLSFDHIAEAADGGTRATLRIDIEGPLSFLAGLAGAVYSRNLDRSLGALKEMLEGEAPPAPAPEAPPAESPAAEEEPPAAGPEPEEKPEPEGTPEAEDEPKNE